jgi:hypothetical protein
MRELFRQWKVNDAKLEHRQSKSLSSCLSYTTLLTQQCNSIQNCGTDLFFVFWLASYFDELDMWVGPYFDMIHMRIRSKMATFCLMSKVPVTHTTSNVRPNRSALVLFAAPGAAQWKYEKRMERKQS